MRIDTILGLEHIISLKLTKVEIKFRQPICTILSFKMYVCSIENRL